MVENAKALKKGFAIFDRLPDPFVKVNDAPKMTAPTPLHAVLAAHERVLSEPSPTLCVSGARWASRPADRLTCISDQRPRELLQVEVLEVGEDGEDSDVIST